MYTIIIIPILFVIIRIYFLVKDRWLDWSDVFLLSLLNLVASFAISFLLAILLPTYTKIDKSTFALVSLQDGSGINGSFFLGSGYINETMKYSFYLSENDGYKLYSIDANNAHVKYTTKKPKLEIFNEVVDDNIFINNFSLPLDLKTNYILYVPKNSILQNYTLDAK